MPASGTGLAERTGLGHVSKRRVDDTKRLGPSEDSEHATWGTTRVVGAAFAHVHEDIRSAELGRCWEKEPGRY